MEILGKLFGSPALIKVMRLFLLNSGISFENKDIAKRSRINLSALRKELSLLFSIGFIIRQKFVKEIESIKKGKKIITKKRVEGWKINISFKYISELKDLLVGSDFLQKDDLATMFKKTGKVKLLLVAGIFIKNDDSRLDLMLVGDKLNKSKIEENIKRLGAEIGKELSYAIFETEEFVYRLDMYDKLVRDVVDYPHERIIESKEFSTYS